MSDGIASAVPRSLSIILACLASLFGMIPHGHGQEKADAASGTGPPPARQLVFLPIGDQPPHREELINGVRIHQPPPPGSIPPRDLRVAVAPEAWLETRLQLGRPGPPLALPAGPPAFDFHDAAAGPPAPPWLRLPIPADGQFLVLLARGGSPPTWSQPRWLVLPNDASGFPPGRVTLVNLADQEIRFLLGKEILPVAPGKSGTRDVGVVAALTLKAARREATGTAAFFHQGEIRLNPGERARVLVYRADGERIRQPYKLMVLKDRPPAPPLIPSPP